MKDKDGIESVQGCISKVYKARDWRGRPVQDAEIKDAGGNTVKLSVWDHPDLTPLEGMEVIIQSGPKGGVSVKYDDYKKANIISIGKGGTFQKLAVHHAQNGTQAATPNALPPTSAPVPVLVNGAKVGMTLNNACQFLVAAGEPFNAKRVHEIASELIRLSNKLEQGELAPEHEDVPY